MANPKKTNIILWASLAASAAGIVVVASVLTWRQRNFDQERVVSKLRDAQEVLSDCYEKIHEIEAHIPAVLTERPLRSNGSATPQNIPDRT